MLFCVIIFSEKASLKIFLNRSLFNKLYKHTFLSNFRNKMLEFLLNKIIDRLLPYKIKGVYHSGVATTHNIDGTVTETLFGEKVYWEENFKTKEEVETFLKEKKGPFYKEGKFLDFLRMENEKTYLVFDNSLSLTINLLSTKNQYNQKIAANQEIQKA